jgi:hypothetical protein
MCYVSTHAENQGEGLFKYSAKKVRIFAPSHYMYRFVSREIAYLTGFLEKLHFPRKLLNRKLMVPPEGTPRELFNE